jgi:hypothetical protein
LAPSSYQNIPSTVLFVCGRRLRKKCSSDVEDGLKRPRFRRESQPLQQAKLELHSTFPPHYRHNHSCSANILAYPPSLDCWHVLRAPSSESYRDDIRKAPAPFLSTRSLRYPSPTTPDLATSILIYSRASPYASRLSLTRVYCVDSVRDQVTILPHSRLTCRSARLSRASPNPTFSSCSAHINEHHPPHQTRGCPPVDAPSPICQAVGGCDRYGGCGGGRYLIFPAVFAAPPPSTWSE